MASFSDYLVAHYRLEESVVNDPAVDAIGTYDLSCNGTPPSAAGRVGNCRDLESGSVQHFDAASAAVVQMANSYSWFLMGWCKPESVAATMHIIGKRKASLEYWLRYDHGETKFQGRVYTNGAAASTDIISTAAPIAGNWYFVVFGFHEPDATLRMAVNDVWMTPVSHTGTINAGAAGFELGAGGGAESFDGLLDEWSVGKNGWPTDAMFTAAYNGGTGVDLTTLLTINDAAGGDLDPFSPGFAAGRPAGVSPYDTARLERRRR